MYSIHLRDLQFFARHGVYAEERQLGNRYVVNLWVDYAVPKDPVDHLADTLNYEELFGFVKERMDHPTPLLETIAAGLTQAILDHFPMVARAEVSIEKCDPPIEGFRGGVVVRHVRAR